MITFYNKYKLTFPAYLLIPAAISGPDKLRQNLDIPVYDKLSYSRGGLSSLQKVIVF